MTLRDAVPKPLQTPLGVTSLGVMMAGVTLGYIITMLGITLYFDLNGSPTAGAISRIESLQVVLVGLICLAAGYVGWRGFLMFSY